MRSADPRQPPCRPHVSESFIVHIGSFAWSEAEACCRYRVVSKQCKAGKQATSRLQGGYRFAQSVYPFQSRGAQVQLVVNAIALQDVVSKHDHNMNQLSKHTFAAIRCRCSFCASISAPVALASTFSRLAAPVSLSRLSSISSSSWSSSLSASN